jgi:hypothetical protein
MIDYLTFFDWRFVGQDLNRGCFFGRISHLSPVSHTQESVSEFIIGHSDVYVVEPKLLGVQRCGDVH